MTSELMTASSPLFSLDSELGCILGTSLTVCLALLESLTGRLQDQMAWNEYTSSCCPRTDDIQLLMEEQKIGHSRKGWTKRVLNWSLRNPKSTDLRWWVVIDLHKLFPARYITCYPLRGGPRETHWVELRQDFLEGNGIESSREVCHNGQCNFAPFHGLKNIIPHR